MIAAILRAIAGSLPVAVLTFLAASGFPAKSYADSSGNWLPLLEIGFDETGELIAWQAGASRSRHFDLIRSGERLTDLRLIIDGKDVGDQVIWRQSPAGPGTLSEYTGHYDDLGLGIRRSYRMGSISGIIVCELSFSGLERFSAERIQAIVTVRPKLRKHTPDDDSLGDYFYGYNRVLATSTKNPGRYENIEEDQEAAEIALVVRHSAIIVSLESRAGNTLVADPDAGARIAIGLPHGSIPQRYTLGALELRGDEFVEPRHSSLLFTTMSRPMQQIARIIEWVLSALTAATHSAGAAVIVFALLLRTLLLPLGLWSIRQQRHFADIQQRMKPRLDEINRTMKGAEKSEEVFATYKEFGITPFSGLKGSIGLFVQLPILIALFAVTTESAMFREISFLWISDISLPDRTVELPFAVPGIGSYLNTLPILLGLICIAAALIQARSGGADGGSSPRSGLILALVFVVFFYPCAAALVLYWIIVNTSQIFEGIYVTRSMQQALQ